MISAVLLVLAAYAAGAIPASHWTGLLHGKDLRTLGSCNLGATNVQRVLGWRAAIPVGLFDVLKGFAPAWWFPQLDGQTASWWAIVYGGAAIVGHCFSFWVRFRGGKGVATSAGVLIAVAPLAAAVGAGTWLIVLLISRKVSVASMAAAVSVPVAGFVAMRADSALLTFLVLMALFVVWAHRSNIRRLLAGEEPGIHDVRKADGGSA
ncbi:MAG: glycerol-3-phosphate 1-O-acyltransferase PlsY [Gemmatimonadetes bacterium]|nr:glycerol-3-phosphate 1-O-acyltransferase PlsY [Gemmatimonadota bacterium]MYE17269.1 glycerol-3-phosphate 1-O-acyltransferase PlsY [Gemmatimonadota bacterium]